ncbi:MAG: hypothetical protein RI947_1529 [Candidatus Parcubacteria bacterium]
MKQIAYKSLLWDVFYLTILTGVSLFLISFYFNAQYLNTGYPDWMVHAFRTKFIQQYGFVSWTHFWSNGISVLKAYQFIPHYITIAVSQIFNVDITRAMVLLTIFQFVLLRIFMYGTIRLLKFSSITAFIVALLSFDIAQYWGGVSDYTLMFASTLFPVVLYLWVKHFEGKLLYLFPYLAGVAFYMHPVLAINCFLLWIFSVIFSDRKIISISNIIQLIIFMAASSLFWYPIVFKYSFNYSSDILANKEFLTLVLSQYDYFGLSIFILTCLVLSMIRSIMPVQAKYKWATVLLVYCVTTFVTVLIGLHLPLPRAITQLQFTRGVTLIGIAILFSFSLAVESARKLHVAAIRGALLFLFCLSLVEGMWFISVYSPSPIAKATEAVSSYVNKYGDGSLLQGRVWTSDIGNASYFAPLSTRFPHSYMGHLESNQIPIRLSPLIMYHPYIAEIPQANLDRLTNYFKISGTKYVFFDETSPFTSSLLDPYKSSYKDKGKLELPQSIYHIFETPGEVRNSVLLDERYKESFTHFPFDLKFSNVNDQIELDDYVHKFVSVLYKPENKTLSVAYPDQETVQIVVPAKRDSRLVYLNESYDTNWKAYYNNKLQTINPSGPNYMLITLDNLEEGGTLILKHSWPTSFYVSIFLIILIPCELALSRLVAYVIKKHNRLSLRAE